MPLALKNRVCQRESRRPIWWVQIPHGKGNFEGNGDPLWRIGPLCGQLCKNERTDRDVVLDLNLGGQKEPRRIPLNRPCAAANRRCGLLSIYFDEFFTFGQADDWYKLDSVLKICEYFQKNIDCFKAEFAFKIYSECNVLAVLLFLFNRWWWWWWWRWRSHRRNHDLRHYRCRRSNYHSDYHRCGRLLGSVDPVQIRLFDIQPRLLLRRITESLECLNDAITE